MNVPNHLAIILDGNRRWAKAHRLPVWMGHRKGYKVFDKFLDWCLELKIPQVSAYVLSTENLSRPKKELDEIFKLAYEILKTWEKKKPILDKYEVRVRFVGDLKQLPPKLVRLMGRIMQRTAKYQKYAINFLVAYGSTFELTETMKKVAEKIIKTGKIEITSKNIEKNLLVPVPVDLLIRTGDTSRLSNFMLWQASYAELIFLPTLWPDFTKKDLIWCIKEYNRRQRRFGR